jgi:hypothetical protein
MVSFGQPGSFDVHLVQPKGPVRTLNNRIGRIKALADYTCAVQPRIYVETFFPAALKAIYTVAIPDNKELYKHVFGHSWLCTVKALFKDGRYAAEGPDVFATEFIFDFFEVTDTIAWWFFIADVFSEAFINWQTAAFQRSGCFPNPLEGPWMADNLEQDIVTSSTPNDTVLAPNNIDPAGGALTAGGLSVPADHHFSFTATWRMQKHNGGIPVTARIMDLATGTVFRERTTLSDFPDNGRVTMGFVGDTYGKGPFHTINLAFTGGPAPPGFMRIPAESHSIAASIY